MTRWIRNLDLKNKLVFLAAVSGTLALLMACAGFVWHDVRLLRTSHIVELESRAEMLAIAGASAISHGQPDALMTTIDAVKSSSSILTICLFGKDGEILTRHPMLARVPVVAGLPADHSSHRYTRTGELELFRPIIDRERKIGVVYIKANLREFHDQVRAHATMIVSLTLCSIAFAVIFASMMQSLISRPILQLADAAKKIATNEDYTIRAAIDSHDELGMLGEAFNQMVTKIQVSQAELVRARNDLEVRVVQRTEELQSEIIRREETQNELVRAKEAAESANVAKSRFLANMSHEIRTPLNGILGFADYVLKQDGRIASNDRQDCLRTIKKSGEGLLVLINDLLDLSKIEEGKMEFERIPFSPIEVVFEVISILNQRAHEKGLNLECRWEGAVPRSIESDPLRFRQLLINLIGNAIKFTEQGHVEVVGRLNRETEQLLIDVKDTGVGIPVETQSILFSPFTQGDSSVTRRFGGTGLGLSICKNIVHGLGGEIQFESESGRGSTFSFSIATGEIQEGDVNDSSQLGTNEKDSVSGITNVLRGKRILIADDVETNRKLIELYLQDTGAEFVSVENGQEAVIAFHLMQFDLILMDMQMPVMDGYSATQILRSEGLDCPIIALTAHAMRGELERCLQVGCSEYLSKPVSQDHLISRIVSLLSANGEPSTIETEVVDNSPSCDPCVSQLPIEEAAFAELVCEFIVNARERRDDIQTAISANDFDRLAKLSHGLVGSAGMAGFSVLSEYARSLEHAAKNGDSKEIEISATKVEDLIERLQSPVVAAV